MALLAVTVTAAALVAGLPGTGTWVHVSAPHFLTQTLGRPQAQTKLVRHPNVATTLKLAAPSFGISHGDVSFTLAAQGMGNAAWRAYKNGVQRPTPFGLETITAGSTSVEQFLTVGRHKGTTTWKWKFVGLPSDLTPRVGTDGYVAFLVGTGDTQQLSQDGFIAPPAILRTSGKQIPQKYLHWSVSSTDGTWWLKLRVNDSKLPTPYVIDPIAMRGTATSSSTSHGTSLTLTGPTGVVANDVMVAQVTTRNNATISSTGSNFTQIGTTVTNGTGMESSAWRRVAAGAEGGNSFVWTWSGSVDATGGIIAFSGVDTTTPVDVSTTTTGTTGGTADTGSCPSSCQATASAITTTKPNDEIIAFYSVQSEDHNTDVTAPQDASQNVSQQYTVLSGSNKLSKSRATGSAGASVQATAGTTGNFTATINNAGTHWVTHTIALQPAAVTATKLAFTTSAQTLTAGVTSGTVTVEREDAGGNAATLGGAITVNLSTSSGGGIFRDTGDTTTITSVTIGSGASSASFKYKDTVAGSPTITAASTGLTSATQVETVNPAAASKVVFGQQPTSALSKATISPAVTVKVEDAFNNVRTADNSTSVSLAIGTNGGTFAAGTLSGGGATTASSGIATFSSLSINNVGTGYTLTASATSLTGDTSSSFNITARAITVTAQTNTKTYDATTSAAATPTVTGTLAAGDTANFIETYDTKNVGSGKTMTPSGTVTDGNSGNNYSYTFVTSANGTINARALTVTGAANTKTYDSTTSSATAPTITSGALQGSDTANFVETYDTKNVGSGKTMTPSGTVTDGNSGNNYTYTFVTSANGTINARALTVTGAATTKTYDSTTSSATAPTITSGALQGSDTANFIEVYANANVGSGKTLTPSGTVSDGNAGNNYSYTFVASANGTITARALTVTGAANTKTYDSTTSSATAPTITSGALQGSDTANFVETYDTKNVGSGKTLTPSGTVTDGNGGNNYSYTFVASTNGTITARALTVTGAANTKTYDSTTSSATAPTITSGALQGSDTANFIEVYANPNVGSGKTLTPSGTVTDGNGGNNYSYTFVASTNGTIIARALTITAAANTKTYDSTTSAAATPTITSGTLQGSDTANFTEVYANANAGSGKTLTPSGSVTDGNSGNNYTYTFVASTNGVINARALTVTAETNTKTYDSTTSAAAIPTITSGALQGSDTANFTEVYGNANAGAGKTLIPSGTVTDGNSGNNYSYTFVNDTTGVINQRALTVTATANTKAYDSTTSASASPTITSGALQGSDTANFTEVYGNANAGTGKTLIPSGTVTDGNSGNNYSYTFVNDTTGVINQRALTVTAQANTKTYDSTTSAATAPSITSGALQGSDTANFTEVYANANVGSGKTLTPSGTVTDGNSGNNYTYTFVASTNGTITARALTVTAQTNTKTYDSTTSAAATPTITSGALQGSDTANFTEVYGNANAGTGKTLIPSGTVADGNGGNNYTYTFVNDTTGVINQRPITVTADGGQTKVYGNADPTFTYTLTSGSLVGTDSFSGALSRAAGENVGTYAIQQGSLTVADGNGGANYAITFVSANFSITQRSLTVTASNQSKTYGTSLSLGTSAFTTNGNEANSEQVTSVTLTSTSGNDVSTTAPVGTYSGDIVPSAATGSSGFLASNYNITYVNGDLSITNASFTLTSAVRIDGTPTVGTTLTITNSVFSPTPSARTQQWQLCDSGGGSCVDISGETDKTYTPVASDVGSTLRVVQTVSRADYNDAVSTSIASAIVIKGDFTTTTPVAINGTPTVGTATTLTAGTYSPMPTSSSYQWRLCDVSGNNCSDIGGATSSTYTPVVSDAGSTLRVVETVSGSGYNDRSSTSDRKTVVLVPITTNTAVSINGTPTVATATTLTAGSYTPTPTSRAYQWRLCDSSGSSCANISGATSNTYTPVAGDVGGTLRVVETVSKSGYSNGSSTSAASPVVVKADFTTSTPVSINGTPKVATATTLTAGSYAPTPTSISYQWRLCDSSGLSCSDISGAINPTYTPVAGDVGGTLRVVETVSKAGYNDGGSTSAASPVVIKASFTTTMAVSINGTPTVGTASTLTAGTYTPTPAGFSYQWQLCDSSGSSCADIGGATNSTYTPVSGDIGSTLRVVETVTKAGYNNGSSTSAASPAVKGIFSTTTAVAIVGTPKVGVQSTTTGGTYTPSPTGRSYQWQRCATGGGGCVTITGATYNTYTPVAADAGKTLRVVETVTKAGYVSGSSTSAASPIVALGTFNKDTNVEIFGYPQVGVTSSITKGSYTPTPTSRSYQWQRCTGTTLASCTDITGATNNTYKPVTADAGKRLRVIETVSAAGYNDFSATSSASTVVTS